MKLNSIKEEDITLVLKELLKGRDDCPEDMWDYVHKPEYFEEAGSFLVKINSGKFKDFFIFINSVVIDDDESVKFSYAVDRVPREVSDDDITNMRGELDQYVTDVFEFILHKALEKLEKEHGN